MLSSSGLRARLSKGRASDMGLVYGLDVHGFSERPGGVRIKKKAWHIAVPGLSHLYGAEERT